LKNKGSKKPSVVQSNKEAGIAQASREIPAQQTHWELASK